MCVHEMLYDVARRPVGAGARVSPPFVRDVVDGLGHVCCEPPVAV